MKFVIQVVSKGEVKVDGQVTGAIGRGFVVLIGVGKGDTKAVADKMYGTYTAYKTTTKRGAVWDPFYVTRISDCPAILLECGFMTNIDDLELLINDTFKKKLCAAVAEGAIAYSKSIG